MPLAEAKRDLDEARAIFSASAAPRHVGSSAFSNNQAKASKTETPTSDNKKSNAANDERLHLQSEEESQRVKDLEAQVKAIKEENTSLKIQVGNLQNRITSMQVQQVKEKGSTQPQGGELQIQGVEDLQVQIAALQLQLGKVQGEFAALQTQLATEEAANADLAAQLKTTEEQNAELARAFVLAPVADQVAALHHRIEYLRDELASKDSLLEIENEGLRVAVAELEKILGLTTELKDLTQEVLDVKEKEIEQLEDQVADLETQVERTNSNVSSDNDSEGAGTSSDGESDEHPHELLDADSSTDFNGEEPVEE